MAHNPRADRNWMLPWQRSERSGDIAYLLAKISWDLFITLTFKNPIPREQVQWQLAWRFCQAISKKTGVPYKSLLLALRWERGELGGRCHFHLLVGGTNSCNIVTLSHQCEHLWRSLTGGICQSRPYDNSRGGVEYLCKNLGMNAYELSKYNWSDEVKLSDSVPSVTECNLSIGDRRRNAHRRKDGACLTVGPSVRDHEA